MLMCQPMTMPSLIEDRNSKKRRNSRNSTITPTLILLSVLIDRSDGAKKSRRRLTAMTMQTIYSGFDFDMDNMEDEIKLDELIQNVYALNTSIETEKAFIHYLNLVDIVK